MQRIQSALVIIDVVIGVVMMTGILLQTPKATGLGGTIGGGDGGLGGGYRTRRGLERQIYMTTWVLVAGFFIVSLANIWIAIKIQKGG
jgi:protein translocase SecG subunit